MAENGVLMFFTFNETLFGITMSRQMTGNAKCFFAGSWKKVKSGVLFFQTRKRSKKLGLIHRKKWKKVA